MYLLLMNYIAYVFINLFLFVCELLNEKAVYIVWFVTKLNDGITINIASLYSWLYLLLGLIAQQEWRVCELLNRILHYIEPRLSHSYQNVREKMGR